MNEFKLIQTPHYPQYDVKITLKPCFRCNHMCWFCPEWNNESNMWSKENCDFVLDKLKQLPEEKKKIFFYFYGGEPTLSPYWEYLQYKITDIFKSRELYIQTQTNLSLSNDRLEKFLTEINEKKQDKHTIDICSSYHLGKQLVDDFIQKMSTCEKHNALGLCFFSTEVEREAQMLDEFEQIASMFPDKIKLKFTVIPGLKFKNKPGYTELLKDVNLVGDDDGRYLEYRYFIKKYPHFREYLEQGWNFNVDGDVLNYTEVKNNKIFEKFKFMKCECGTKGVVIDHNLKVYNCNDDYTNNINGIDLSQVNFEEYLARDNICLNKACWDGLDYKKYSKSK